MATNRRVSIGQHLLLLGVLLYAPAWAQTAQVAKQAATDPTCGSVLIQYAWDPAEGADQIATLQDLNAKLESRLQAGTLSAEDLFTENLVFWSTVPVTDKVGQTVPFRELRLTHAYTGMYIPTAKKGRPIDPSLFDGVMIALPGIGFSISVARSMQEVAGTFNKGSNHSLAISANKKIRLISVPMDPPLNGMGEAAPFGWGHPDGVMAVLRHASLVLQAMYPGKPRFMIGRSQGGLNVIKYSQIYTDIAAVVALNPTNDLPEIHDACIRNHEWMALPENVEIAKQKGFDCVFHYKSWAGQSVFTPHYNVINGGPSKVPVLLQLGDEDISYPQPDFIDSWKAWTDKQPLQRRVSIYNGAHNLWTRVVRRTGDEELDHQRRQKAERTYDDVTGEIARFFAPHLNE